MQNNLNFNAKPLNLTSPLEQIRELNQKILKKISYIEPEELTQIFDPKTLLHKHMDVFINNSHTSLDYMHQLFNILENSWITLSNEAEEKTKNIMQTTKSATTSTMNKMSPIKSKAAHPQSASHSSKKRTSNSSSHTSRAHKKMNETKMQ